MRNQKVWCVDVEMVYGSYTFKVCLWWSVLEVYIAVKGAEHLRTIDNLAAQKQEIF